MHRPNLVVVICFPFSHPHSSPKVGEAKLWLQWTAFCCFTFADILNKKTFLFYKLRNEILEQLLSHASHTLIRTFLKFVRFSNGLMFASTKNGRKNAKRGFKKLCQTRFLSRPMDVVEEILEQILPPCNYHQFTEFGNALFAQCLPFRWFYFKFTAIILCSIKCPFNN